MHKWSFKKKFCVYASISLAVIILIVGCIFAVVDNFVENKNKITFYMPDGAPALACAKLLSEDQKDDGIEYSVVSSNVIASKVTSSYESQNADFCVLPLTDASNLLSDGKDYQALGVLTHGNFFMISESTETYDQDNLESLVGKKIGFVQLPKLPGMVFCSILQQRGIEYAVVSDLESCRDGVVNLINIQPTSAVKGTGYDLFVLPEPAATTKVEKAGFNLVGSVQDLYGGAGYSQAVLVAKRSIIEKKGDVVQKILEKLRANEQWLQGESVTPQTVLSAIQSHLEEGLTPSFDANNFSKVNWKEEIRLKYGAYFTDGESAKSEITLTMQRIQQVDEKVKPFAEGFLSRLG